MFRALWNAASGMESQQTNLDVITNNLANVNTTRYKRQRANFQDLMYQT
ncbi:flagellar basal-body rod protein flgg, partial [mine drainage metagenome]